MTRAAGAIALAIAGASSVAAQGTFHVESTPPACVVAEKAPVLIACLTPRTARADVRVLFRADDGPWYAAPMRHEMPCYRGLLPRPTAGTPRITYVVEAHRAGMIARSAEHAVPVQDSCAGAAPVATGRATWDAPSGAPKTPAGFEGSKVRETGPPPRTAEAPVRPSREVGTLPATPERIEPRSPPAPPSTPPPPASSSAESKASGGGHGLRNAVIVLGGVAAAGGGVVVARSSGNDSPPPATTGTGLPAGGISGTYVGIETVVYSPSCTGTDDVVLNLQQSGSSVSGILTFTVRTCPCCASGRGAAPISGSLADTRIDFSTPIGFGYSGTFAGIRLSGSLSGPGGVSGTWTVDKR